MYIHVYIFIEKNWITISVFKKIIKKTSRYLFSSFFDFHIIFTLEDATTRN